MASVRTNEWGQPIGPSMDHWVPRTKPPLKVLQGQYCYLEPMDAEKHTPDLWEAFGKYDGRAWTYLFADPPATQDEMLKLHAGAVARDDYIPYTIMSGKTHKAVGTLSYMNMYFQDGGIEIGSINLSLDLRKTCMSTEAIYLAISRVIDDLGYRRVVWKCDAFNSASRAAAIRYGFTFEGIFRNHMILKGRSRDTAWFSITDYEWPARKAAFESWLAPENFDSSGAQIRKLSDFMPPHTPAC